MPLMPKTDDGACPWIIQDVERELNLDEPCPTVMQNCRSHSGFWFKTPTEMMTMPKMPKRVEGKPPYRVPSMVEIRRIKSNGFTVASTFSGCGGSCLGWRMAGFRVGWANEFVPSAQRSYLANTDPSCVLDLRDVRQVQPEDILKSLNIKKGMLDVFEGSPPCQSFSVAGKRHKGWGQEKAYEGGHSQCNETLFDEYLRLLRGLMPKVFVAENVSGLVKGTAKGTFLEVLAGMKATGYRVHCKVLDAQWLGVPQVRQRCIFVGVRDDIKDRKGNLLQPVFPVPLPWRYSVLDACPWLTGPVVTRRGGWDGEQSLDRFVSCPTLTGQRTFHEIDLGDADSPTVKRRKFTINELKRICAFPDDFQLDGSYAQQWKCLGNSVPPEMMKTVAETVCERILMIAT